MDDQFLYGLRQAPSPEFAARLRTQLRGKDGSKPLLRRTLLKTAAGVAAVALAGSVFLSPNTRAIGGTFLELFRTVNIAPISVDTNRFATLMKSDVSIGRMLGGQMQIVKDGGAPTSAADVDDAVRMAGIAVRSPTDTVDLRRQAILVAGPQQFQIVANTQLLRKMMSTLEINDLALPDDLDGQTINASLSPVVSMIYANSDHRVQFAQSPSPSIVAPGNLNVPLLAEIGLRVLGMTPQEAHRLAEVIDWRTTLILPFPANVAQIEHVDVNGSHGLIVKTGSMPPNGERVAPTKPKAMLVWADGKQVYTLDGDVSAADLLIMARSMQ